RCEWGRLAHGTVQLVIANPEHVTVLDRFALHPLTAELDAVGGTHVDHVEVAAGELDQGVLARDIGVADREVGRRFAPSNDESSLGHGVGLTLKEDSELLAGGGAGGPRGGRGAPRSRRNAG